MTHSNRQSFGKTLATIQRCSMMRLVFITILPAAFIGCNAIVQPSTVVQSSTINIQAAQLTVQAGSTDKFSATQNGAVVSGGQWSVVGTSIDGTIDPDGTYHAPAIVSGDTEVTVDYISTGQPYTSTITVVPAAPVTIEMSQTAVSAQGTDQLSAFQQGNPLLGGQWEVVGGDSNGTIDGSGLYHAPSVVPVAADITIEYSLLGQTASATITILPLASPQQPALSIAAAQPTVVTGGTDQFTVVQTGVSTETGSWVVLGGTSNGTITQTGMYQAPTVLPSPSDVTVGYIVNQQAYLATINIVNSPPVLSAVSPATLTALSTEISITGGNFSSGEEITVNGTPIATTYIDLSHLSATVTLPSPTNTTLQIAIISSDGVTSNTISLPVIFSTFEVQPSVLVGGPVSLSISGSGFKTGDIVSVAGAALSTTINSSSSITATGFLLPWLSGNVVIEIAHSDGIQPYAALSVPIQATPVTYDAAARFTTQAAFGPRPDVVQDVQSLGFDGWITQQLQQSPIIFNPASSGKTQYIHAVVGGNSLLRQRLSLALQSFIVPQDQDFDPSVTEFETMLERDSTGNFRQLLTDITSSPNLGWFLNLANNQASTNTLVQPNQNFAREVMQLFSIGPFMLNDDGSVQTDINGNPLPAYTQDTVIELTRALTGWVYPQPQNPVDTVWGVDWSLPLAPMESYHDHNAKLLFGSVVLPGSQTAEQDRDMALDAIFNHPNVPPFIAHLLIQRLVTSNPSPAYIQRISQVFENNGSGIRGDMAAVVRAILLDSEARQGDTVPSPSDGFLKDPYLFELSTMSVLNDFGSDDQPDYVAGSLGENIWNAPTVFGFFSPAYRIPGTTISSPEFQLLTNISIAMKSNILWGIVNNTQPGFTNDYQSGSWLFQYFTTVPSMLDALNHLLYHGMMSQQEMTAITTYCATLNPFDIQSQLRSAIFLALDAESNDVSH